jgi:hypothetical protein
LIKTFSLVELKYSGLEKSKEYKIQLSLNVEKEFNALCPRIWTGEIISKQFIISW